MSSLNDLQYGQPAPVYTIQQTDYGSYSQSTGQPQQYQQPPQYQQHQGYQYNNQPHNPSPLTTLPLKKDPRFIIAILAAFLLPIYGILYLFVSSLITTIIITFNCIIVLSGIYIVCHHHKCSEYITEYPLPVPTIKPLFKSLSQSLRLFLYIIFFLTNLVVTGFSIFVLGFGIAGLIPELIVFGILTVIPNLLKCYFCIRAAMLERASLAQWSRVYVGLPQQLPLQVPIGYNSLV